MNDKKISLGIIGFGVLNPIVGLSQYMRHVIKNMPESFDMTLYTFDDSGIEELKHLKNLRVVSVKKPRDKQIFKRIINNLTRETELFMKLMKENHDVLLATGEREFYQILLYKYLKKRDTKIVFNIAHITGGLTLSEQFKERRFFGLVTRLFFFPLLRAVELDAIITISETFKKIIHSEFNKPNGKIKIAYVGYDSITNKKPEKPLNIKFGRPSIYTGMAQPSHNLELVVKALPLIKKRYPSASFVITGRRNEEYFEKLLEMAKELGVEDSINYLGIVPEENLEEVYTNSDVISFVPTEPYGWSIVIMKGIYYKKPCVALNSGALRELILRYDGKLIRNDPKEFAEAVIKFVSNKEYTRKIVERAYRNLQRDTWTATANIHAKTIEELIRGKLWIKKLK